MTTPNNPDVRKQLRSWIGRNRWTCEQIVAAMRKQGKSYVLSAHRLGAFRAGELTLHHKYLLTLTQFLCDHPNPGSPRLFLERAGDVRRQQIMTRHEEYLVRQMEMERRRTDYERKCLEQEHKPKQADPGVLFGLPKDVVLALSGGLRT